jgi:hypothetical protein
LIAVDGACGVGVGDLTDIKITLSIVVEAGLTPSVPEQKLKIVGISTKTLVSPKFFLSENLLSFF